METNKTNVDDPILRQLKIMNTMLAILITDKDFSNHTQTKQISILGKLGLKNKELTEMFGISKQQVTNALAQAKKKKMR